MAGIPISYPIAVLAFVAATAVIGVLAVKLVKKSSKRYIVAGKSLPLFFIGTMLVSESVDGNASLGNVSLTFTNGFWSGAAIPLGLSICLVLTGAFFGKIFNRMNMITLADFYFRRYGNTTEVMSGTIMAISFIVLVAGNLGASGYILSVVLSIPLIYAMLISTAVVLLYTYFGGLFSCAYTDIFHIYLAVVGFWAGFLYFIGPWSPIPGGLETIVANVPGKFMDMSGLFDINNGALLNWATIIGLGLGDIVALDFMERVFAADGGRTAEKGCYMAAGITLAILIPTTMIGIIGHTLEPNITDPFTLYPIMAIKHVPEVIGILMLVSTVSCGMSTANGGTLAIASVLSRNILQRNILRKLKRKGRGMTDRQLLIATRLLVIPMFFTAFALGALVPRPGIYLVLAFDIVLAGCFVPLVLGTYWKKSTAAGAVASIAVGSTLRLILYFIISTAPPSSPYFAYAGLDTMIPPIVSLIVFVSVSLATQKRTPPRPDVLYLIPSDDDVVSGADVSEWVKPIDVRQAKSKGG
ncbi:MAG TPA: sodium:solute symporter family protein [Nitrososphaeraceae archaeon]|jgi:Na+/proline symporter|nr:sodium:solute symporter family protein [Nitrososphaeraceae archaeon]